MVPSPYHRNKPKMSIRQEFRRQAASMYRILVLLFLCTFCSATSLAAALNEASTIGKVSQPVLIAQSGGTLRITWYVDMYDLIAFYDIHERIPYVCIK